MKWCLLCTRPTCDQSRFDSDCSLKHQSTNRHVTSLWTIFPNPRRPDFITLYFDEPDHAGHSYGPDDIAKVRIAGHRLYRPDNVPMVF
jgi:predicted AlkP superfamily pyrophosphatase or phosphodiesterase